MYLLLKHVIWNWSGSEICSPYGLHHSTRASEILSNSRCIVSVAIFCVQVSNLGDFLLSHRGWFNSPALKLLLCQAACLLAALAQLYAMDLLLHRRFLGLGVLSFDRSSLGQALQTVFPKVVMCSMEIFGATGTHLVKSGICTLPINIVNEKIYLFLWFWFLLVTMVSLLQLVRQAALLVPSLRTCPSPGMFSKLSSPRQVRLTATGSQFCLAI